MNITSIDLHMHTSVSDGTDTPAELLSRVKETGLKVFSVTDHDAIKCAALLPQLLGEGDPAFVTGVEFSCKDEEGKYHILGYGYDPSAQAIQSVVGLGHSLRMEKVRARLDYLKSEYGFAFSEEELSELLSLENPGKPHIAKLMIRRGYAESMQDAIGNYIDGLHLKNKHVRPEAAISGILQSGGIPVLAHPIYGSGDQLILGEEMEDRIRRLMAFGLKGMECFYSGFTEKMRNEMLRFAERFSLYVTAGSDYHGSNKLVRLGDTGLAESGLYPDGLKQFLKDVNIHGF